MWRYVKLFIYMGLIRKVFVVVLACLLAKWEFLMINILKVPLALFYFMFISGINK